MEISIENELFRPTTTIEELEARRIQEIAERAERRALDKQKNSLHQSSISEKHEEPIHPNSAVYLSKAEREKLALERLELKRMEREEKLKTTEEAYNRFVTGKALEEKRRLERTLAEKEAREKEIRRKEENKEVKEIDYELKSIRDHYLGQAEKKRKIICKNI
jgi:hypothetical protein